MRNLIPSELAQSDRLEQRHIDGFKKDGVDLLDLAASGIRRDWIVVDGDRFEFARNVKGGAVARSAFVWPVQNAYSEVADIAAWCPGRDLTTWLGAVCCLGEEQTNGVGRLCDPLEVHTSVLDWFRARRQGIYIIDWRRAADILRSESLGAQNALHAGILRKRLTIQPPPVVILEGARGGDFPPLQSAQHEPIEGNRRMRSHAPKAQVAPSHTREIAA